MVDTPIRDWLEPRLHALVAEAVVLGFAPDAVVAVITDLATGPAFNHAPPPTEPMPSGVPVAEVPHDPPPDYSAPSIGNVGDWFNPESVL